MSDELDFWREATDIPGSAVTALHARVMGRIGNRRRWPLLPFAIPAAVLAGVIALAIFLWPQPVETLALSPPMPPGAPELVLPKPARTGAKHHATRPVSAQSRDTAVIQLETADPDVVILLVSSDGGAQ